MKQSIFILNGMSLGVDQINKKSVINRIHFLFK